MQWPIYSYLLSNVCVKKKNQCDFYGVQFNFVLAFGVGTVFELLTGLAIGIGRGLEILISVSASASSIWPCLTTLVL